MNAPSASAPRLHVRRILFATDFSEGADRALEQALVWRRHFDAELDVLHVVSLPEENPVYPPRYASDSAEVWPGIKARLREELERRVPSSAAGGAVRHAVARNRSPATAIARYVVHRDIDLAVMGTQGRRGVRALLLGSVTEATMREARCPILAVPRLAERGATSSPFRILAPIDFSPFALQTARHAKAAAAAFGASLLYLHVIESGRVPDFYLESPTSLERAEEAIRARAVAALERIDEEAGGDDVPVEIHVVPGRPAVDITGFADAHGVDLVVIPTHGLSAIDRLLVGSVADKVVRRARCPILILQPYGKQIVVEAVETARRAGGSGIES